MKRKVTEKTKNLKKVFLTFILFNLFSQPGICNEKKEKENYDKVSDLQYLAPFKDVVIIQRRYLPKSKRIELSGSAIFNLQNSLFNNGGGTIRAGFHFTEQIGLEVYYSILKNEEKSLTQRLNQNFNAQLQRFIRPFRYIGGSLKWSPIYGKLSLLNRHIVPFDLFFNFNSGVSYIENSSKALFFGLGVGQIFSLGKSSALRWDLNWNTFKPKLTKNTQVQQSPPPRMGYQNNIFISLGFSVFFPKAHYR